jgi:hypothetical protein
MPYPTTVRGLRRAVGLAAAVTVGLCLFEDRA